jgi:hypothetical protein
MFTCMLSNKICVPKVMKYCNLTKKMDITLILRTQAAIIRSLIS